MGDYETNENLDSLRNTMVNLFKTAGRTSFMQDKLEADRNESRKNLPTGIQAQFDENQESKNKNKQNYGKKNYYSYNKNGAPQNNTMKACEKACEKPGYNQNQTNQNNNQKKKTQKPT